MIVAPNRRRTRSAQYVALCAYLLFLGFPLLWMLSVSFKGPRELVELHPHLIPSEFTLDNYRQAIEQNGLLHSAWNSTKVAVLTSLLTTLVGLPAAYVLARQKGLISRIGLGWILLSQMFPLILIIIPLFLLLRHLHLTDSHAGLVFVYMVWTLPFILWMLQSYVRGIPRDLEEAAMVDGASTLRRFFTITLPQLRPVIVAITTLDFIWNFNSFGLVWVLTQGGPGHSTELPMLFAYNAAFKYGEFGYASALGDAMVVVIACVLVFYLWGRLKETTA